MLREIYFSVIKTILDFSLKKYFPKKKFNISENNVTSLEAANVILQDLPTR
jgi:hypothetical protein